MASQIKLLQSGGVSPESAHTRSIPSVPLHLQRSSYKLPSFNPTWRLFSTFFDVFFRILKSRAATIWLNLCCVILCHDMTICPEQCIKLYSKVTSEDSGQSVHCIIL